jgi:tetratricopeptide (TPR) repeat protein
METVLQNQNHGSDLLQRKSLLIIQAQFQQAIGQHGEAVRLFLEAALLEEKIADHFQQQGSLDDAAISLFSAASCYKNAGAFAKAITLAEEAMTLTSSGEFVKEIQQFRNDCEKALAPAGQRTLRGIVRNGAVHPFDSGVLAEGELVTITAA